MAFDPSVRALANLSNKTINSNNSLVFWRRHHQGPQFWKEKCTWSWWLSFRNDRGYRTCPLAGRLFSLHMAEFHWSELESSSRPYVLSSFETQEVANTKKKQHEKTPENESLTLPLLTSKEGRNEDLSLFVWIFFLLLNAVHKTFCKQSLFVFVCKVLESSSLLN